MASESIARSTKSFFLAVLVLLAVQASAQTKSARVVSVEPPAAKVNDSVTVTGEGLGKNSASAVFLSDDKNDYKATIVDQTEDKIVMKVPQVKPGDYNVSVQVGNNILIQPVRLKVQE